MIKPSLVILTWNREYSVQNSLSANIASAGYPLHEIVHVDNGSEPGFCERFDTIFKPAVQIRFSRNRGVAAGYNAGLAAARGTHTVITGCDRIMPDGWLKAMVDAFEKNPQIGVISCYTKTEKTEPRLVGDPYVLGGIKIQHARAVEARMHSKDFLFKCGYFREDFGIYGYEDSEWSDRAFVTCARYGLISCILPELGFAEHLSDSDFGLKIDGKEYHEFKHAIHSDPRRLALHQWCHRNGSPYYNPYSQVEPNRLEEMST